jgi:hypothetical protein
MRMPRLFSAGLVIAMAAGCSERPVQTAGADAGFAAELELAIGAALAGEGTSVLSPLELTRSDGAGEAPVVAPAGIAAVRPPLRAGPALLGRPVEAVAGAAATPAADPEPTLVADEAAGEPGDGLAAADRGRPRAGIRPRIIIRGGVLDGDDCKIHLGGRDGIVAGLGPAGAMINDRVPPGIGIGARGSPGGGLPAHPRPGGGFAGGIR